MVELWLSKLFRILPRIHPNVITVIGIVPPVLFYYFLSHQMLIPALISFCGIVIDLFDGVYARSTNQVTKFGAFLDSSLDRIADAIFISAFAAAGIVSWPVAVLLTILSFTISYVRSRGENLFEGKVTIASGPIERAERLAILFLALLVYIFLPDVLVLDIKLTILIFWTLIILSIVTIINRVRLVYSKSA